MKRPTVPVDDRAEARVAAAFGVDRAQRLDLRSALLHAVILEMRRDHAYAAERRAHDRFQRDARHAVDARIDGVRQQMPEHLADRITGEDHVAEVASAAFLRRNVDCNTGHRLVLRQQPGERGELILAPAPRQPRIGKIVGDLLQAEHVEIGDRLGMLDDPRRVDLVIDAATPLSIPGDELHLIPARMKD